MSHIIQMAQYDRIITHYANWNKIVPSYIDDLYPIKTGIVVIT